jgi:predicted dehydrogenase
LSQKIRVGIIGANFGAKVHAEAFRLDSRTEVVALAAKHLSSAKKAAQDLKIPLVFTDWRKMLKTAGLDAVSIAVPPKFQPEMALEALKQGIAVFAEKPLALSVGLAKKMARAAKKSRVAHMIDYELVEIPAWIYAKKLLNSGAIGKVRHVSINWRVETYANQHKKISWKTEKFEGGGALSAFGCHSLNALEWFLGPILRLSANVGQAPDLPGKGDTLSVLAMEFANGAFGSAEISTHAFPSTGHEIRFFGEKGQFWLVNSGADYVRGFKLYLADRKRPKFRLIHIPGDINHGRSDGRIEATGRLVKKFIDWIKLKKPSRPDFSDALRVERLLETARKSAKNNGLMLRMS